MKALALAALFACALGAQDYALSPLRVWTSGTNMEPCSLHVSFDKPAGEVKTLEILLIEQLWIEEALNRKLPDWRVRLAADDFDAKKWHEDGGPRLERVRLAVDPARVPQGLVDRRDRWIYNYVAVLFVDAEGKRTPAANLKSEKRDALAVSKDAYLLPSYFPWMTAQRVWDRSPTKIEWEIPDLGGGIYEIEKIIFVGHEKTFSWLKFEAFGWDIDGWLAGKHPTLKPLWQELPKDCKGCWVEKLNFYYPWVLAVTKSGHKIVCALKNQTPGKAGADYSGQATEEDKKTLVKLELKRAGD